MSTSELTPAELDYLRGLLDLARTGQTAELAHAIDSGVPVNLTNGAGDSLLILAAYHCHADTVDMLLSRGADTERVNDQGQTALAAATFRQRRSIMASLMKAGADPHTGPKSAVQIARFFGLRDLAKVLERSQLGSPNFSPIELHSTS
jgi:ankyrin repeat protein